MAHIVFYAAGAAVSAMAFRAFYDGPPTMLVGASGAVSATLGAFLFYFHGARIRIWYWLLVFHAGTFNLKASVALPLWFGIPAMPYRNSFFLKAETAPAEQDSRWLPLLGQAA